MTQPSLHPRPHSSRDPFRLLRRVQGDYGSTPPPASSGTPTPQTAPAQPPETFLAQNASPLEEEALKSSPAPSQPHWPREGACMLSKHWEAGLPSGRWSQVKTKAQNGEATAQDPAAKVRV